MGVQGFSHYNLRAPRAMLEELRAFYCEVVGLTLGARPPLRSFGYWLFAGGRDVLHLVEAAADENRSGSNGTFDHAAFNCTDRAAYEAKLTTLGIAFRASSVPQSRRVQLFFKDPAGNGVELNFDPESFQAPQSPRA